MIEERLLNNTGSLQLENFFKITLDFRFELSYLDGINNKGAKMRMMQKVHWQGKNYDMPFSVNLEWDKGTEVEIRNRFSGEPCKLPWFAAAVYDLIMGSERLQDWKTHREGLDWFIENFPEEYMVLLD